MNRNGLVLKRIGLFLDHKFVAVHFGRRHPFGTLGVDQGSAEVQVDLRHVVGGCCCDFRNFVGNQPFERCHRCIHAVLFANQAFLERLRQCETCELLIISFGQDQRRSGCEETTAVGSVGARIAIFIHHLVEHVEIALVVGLFVIDLGKAVARLHSDVERTRIVIDVLLVNANCIFDDGYLVVEFCRRQERFTSQFGIQCLSGDTLVFRGRPGCLSILMVNIRQLLGGFGAEFMIRMRCAEFLKHIRCHAPVLKFHEGCRGIVFGRAANRRRRGNCLDAQEVVRCGAIVFEKIGLLCLLVNRGSESVYYSYS